MEKNLENSEPISEILSIQPPSASKDLARLVLLGEEHSGRDEMNLAGHPFALLQAATRTERSEPIYYEWPRVLPDGRKVTASWRVEGGQTGGMPGPNEELLHLVMLQMTREAAENAGAPREWPQVVHFSRGDVLARMGWDDCKYRFDQLSDCFTRLNAVTITAKWAFYDARTKAPMQSAGFHVLSGFGITPEPSGRRKSGALPLSWWKWDDVLYNSFLAGNVRSLALEFTLSLRSPTARRLFRLLESWRHMEKTPRASLAVGTFKLRDRLGMTAYKHPSKVREKLLAGIEELQIAGYLGEVGWDKARDGSPLACFAFGGANVPSLPTATPKTRQRAAMGPITPLSVADADATAEEINTPRRELLWAHAMCEKYEALPDEVRERLRGEAREGCGQWLWDRLENPDSPASWELWEMVERETN